MEFKNLKMQESQTTENNSVSFMCDINTGICGPVSSEKTTFETINSDFLNNQKDEGEGKK